MVADKIKKLPIADMLKSSFQYFNSKPMAMLSFCVLNYIIVLIGLYTWSKPTFLLLAVVAYAFWSYFFRFYFNKKPYLQTKSLVSSLAPSTKILVIGFVILTILIVLPFAPLFLGFNGQYADRYLAFLKKYMQDSQAIDTILGIITVFIAPYIFYRPFFAWIGSLIGRNGNVRFALAKTKGNYWQIVALLLILNIPFMVIDQLSNLFGFSIAPKLLLMSPLIVYSNIIIARSYEFFFIED